jgi:hypothetical protein
MFLNDGDPAGGGAPPCMAEFTKLRVEIEKKVWPRGPPAWPCYPQGDAHLDGERADAAHVFDQRQAMENADRLFQRNRIGGDVRQGRRIFPAA